jgi:hypothetical protein
MRRDLELILTITEEALHPLELKRVEGLKAKAGR